MKLALIAVVILLVVSLVLRQRDRKRPPPPRAGGDRRRISQGSGRFHAVSIKAPAEACAAAKALVGERFLSAEAPQLPLPECDADACPCRFQHHADRRSGKDRRSPFASGGTAAATGKYEQERRSGEERRRDEDEDDGSLY